MRQLVLTTVVVSTAALSLLTSCGGGGGTTTSPGLGINLPGSGGSRPSGSTGGTGTTRPGTGSDTDLNIPGGGGAVGTGFMPSITVPPTESFSNDAAGVADDVDAWLINCVESLPSTRSGSGVFQNESLQNWAYAIYEAANAAREAEGLEPMQYEPHLEVLAQAHARDMALRDYFGHDSPDGVLMWDRWLAMQVPYCNWAGENAAMGQETVSEVIEQWLRSPGHRKNLMKESAQWCGVGVYFDPSERDMPLTIIMEYANFRDDPMTHQWYERGDVFTR
jgi:uncharacterized protein YkwD